MSKDVGMSGFFNRGKPFFGVIFLQFGFAGMDILSKAALNEGMSNYVRNSASFRLEKLNLKNIRSQAKVIGTVTTLAGAMMMTLMKGPVLELFWTKGRTDHQSHVNSTGVDVDLHNSLMGAFMITVGCFSWSAFMVLQVITIQASDGVAPVINGVPRDRNQS
ncbi:hypothetical protein Ccrd_007462 [Cynara cardunculus var. scolymus]|uniref:Uncharacterized protein n=1 Tax=Cynara cardunculus var. scolymus TaxID=59895 RepID=A0A103XGZ5_CYNCS|nr:hypothetical protein Ccrd_007462 [Cynara cardunculus var. scolymus]